MIKLGLALLFNVGAVVLFMSVITKAGRAWWKRVLFKPYTEKHSDKATVNAVVTFAEEVAATQTSGRVDMFFLRGMVDAHVASLEALLRLTKAQSAYFREIGMKHLKLSLPEVATQERQQPRQNQRYVRN